MVKGENIYTYMYFDPEMSFKSLYNHLLQACRSHLYIVIVITGWTSNEDPRKAEQQKESDSVSLVITQLSIFLGSCGQAVRVLLLLLGTKI